jgi:hypothetical protein
VTDAPIICLGVGATKSGTSWLHRYLAGHPGCHFRSIKELHYFDALERGTVNRQIATRSAEVAALTARAASGRAGPQVAARLADRTDWLRVLTAGREDVPGYIDYLLAGRAGRAVVGEVTPAYALVSEDRLHAMATMAPDVRFVYLMRDPVARLWSHVRMIAGRRSGTGVADAARCGRILRRTMAGDEPEIATRGDYKSALDKFARAIDPARLLVLVFEDLVSGRAAGRLSAFLGLEDRAPDPAPVHVGQALALSPEQARAARGWLQPQYEHVAGYLGYQPRGWCYDSGVAA